MSVRWDRVLLCTAAWAALPAGPALPASESDVPMPLMQAAECMAGVLRTVRNVTDIEIDVAGGAGTAYPVLQYSAVDESGRRRFTELRLFAISGVDDARFVFDRADIANDIVAPQVLERWKSRCQAGVGNITSTPG